MRVMFTIFPATAHLHPVVPLAWALQNAGHEVVVACQEGTLDPAVIGNITSAGLTAVPLSVPADGLDPEVMRSGLASFADVWRFDPTRPADTGDWHTARSLLTGMFDLAYGAGGAGSVLDGLVAFAQAWRPDLVLWDPLMFPAAIAARVTGAAHARLVWGLDDIAVLHERTVAELADPRSAPPGGHPWLSWLGPMLERHGLGFTDEMLLGQWTLDLTLARMRPPLELTPVPVRRIPYNGASTLPPWLHARPARPRVVLTLGISRRLVGAKNPFPVREFLDRVATLDVEVVASIDERQLTPAGPLPDNVRAVDYIPLNQVLPTSSAIIHHGGSGTLGAAIAHRVPQLVVPLAQWDEWVTARQVADFGAGLVADTGALDADALHRQLVELIQDPRFARAAQSLYEETLAAPAPADVVPLLEKLTAETRGTLCRP